MQEQIMKDLKAAMLAGEKAKVEVLRMVKTAIQMAQIDAKGELSEEEQLKILAREAKKRREAAKIFADAGDQTRADKEVEEAEQIEAYLPAQMSDEELSAVVDRVMIELESANMGAIISKVMAETSGQADGGRISALVRERLG